MRVYLPATLHDVRALWASRQLPPLTGGTAVTPTLREWYAEGNREELEDVALHDAARESLRRLAAAPDAPRRRVVVAADLPDGAVRPAPDRGRSAVEVAAVVRLADVAAVHVDEPDAADAVAAAVRAEPAAAAGDDDAQFTVDAADGFELQWWATQELDTVLGERRGQ